MKSDPLSDVLRMTEARSIMTGGFAVRGTWGFAIERPNQIVIAAIAKGSCWLRLDGHKAALHLEQGDVGLLDGTRSFKIGSSPDAPTQLIVASDKRGQVVEMAADPDCVVLIGRVSLNPDAAALLVDILPPRIHIRASSPTSVGLRSLVEQLLAEQRALLPGASAASERLAELIFIQILRAHVASGKVSAGWLRATSDPRLVRALEAIHGAPGRGWTLEELAKTAGMSRTRFAVRFKSVVGAAPLAYVAEWRMRLAQKRLREDGAAVSELARSFGYASESAFSTAFKRITGSSPRRYRANTSSPARSPTSTSASGPDGAG